MPVIEPKMAPGDERLLITRLVPTVPAWLTVPAFASPSASGVNRALISE